jgi:phosphatidylinositol-3-phosphatase
MLLKYQIKSMNTNVFRLILLLFIIQTNVARSQSTIPVPDHIVVAILESHSYSQLIGSSAAPYINSLANDTSSALFAESFAVAHPSQPNYLVLYSGSTQGVTDNSVPSDNPFATANLGRQLIDSGRTFITYSEDLPEVGFNGATSDYYARKHNPVTNWVGTGENQVSPALNQPFTTFSSSDFSSLPTVCYVIPNLENDMHNGSDPDRITKGDEWLSNNIDSYIHWAKNNNSLFILTFDEEDGSSVNHIMTIFTGQMVKSGIYSSRISHYSILHTIEKMYGLPFIGDSLKISAVTYCWKGYSDSTATNDSISDGTIYPNPCNGILYLKQSDYEGATAEIYNLNGQLIQHSHLESTVTSINTDHLVSGFYLLKIKNNKGILIKKFIRK